MIGISFRLVLNHHYLCFMRHPDIALNKTSQSNVLIYYGGLSDPKTFHFGKESLNDFINILQSYQKNVSDISQSLLHGYSMHWLVRSLQIGHFHLFFFLSDLRRSSKDRLTSLGNRAVKHYDQSPVPSPVQINTNLFQIRQNVTQQKHTWGMSEGSSKAGTISQEKTEIFTEAFKKIFISVQKNSIRLCMWSY